MQNSHTRLRRTGDDECARHDEHSDSQNHRPDADNPHDDAASALGVEAIPASAIVPFHEAAPSRDKQLLEYRGEPGTALRHVGVLVGHAALTTTWPRIIDWMARR